MDQCNGRHNADGLADAAVRQQRRDLDLLRRHLNLFDSDSHANAITNGSTNDSLLRVRQSQPNNTISSPLPGPAIMPSAFVFVNDRSTKSTNVSLSTERNPHKNRAGSIVRVLFLDLPLAALFVTLLGSYHARYLYKEYFVHVIKAAGRASSDDQLQSEYTYYDRECTKHDMSTHTISDLLLTNSTTPTEAVHHMMKHGATVIPRVLQPSTVQALREFIVRRNTELTDEDAIIVSQGEGNTRTSFGIDATEDPIVSIALKEIATHPMLQPLIEGLVGTDPAITEITAITARFGAKHQVWHPDVKPDGSGVKFGRTFSHSYSMFVALQDTTSEMGATEICPGTHYCANWLDVMCASNGIQLNNASPEKIWHAGDAALINQQVWHRGYKHSDPNSLERVVFIVSFIGRPQYGLDHRQLSRGTYFHMKWNMWGHTWKDLQDSQRSMAKPFSILRCLGIWKPKNRNWGYDLVTSGMMRLANGQMGLHWEELPDFINTVVKKFGIPKIMQGRILKNRSAWETYLRETLEKCLTVLEVVNLVVMVTYGIGVLLVSLKTRKSIHTTRAFVGLCFTHILPAFYLHRIQRQIESSQWGQNVKLGRLLKEPFHLPFMKIDDPSLSIGPTTLPSNKDVLIGSRFDSKFLGSYNQWLEYHPGNTKFRSAISYYGPLLKSYRGLPDSFSEQLVNSALANISGRFLEQDWRNGQWKVMTRNETKEHVRIALILSSNQYLKTLHSSIALQLAHYRFDITVRHTMLGLDSQERLVSLRHRLLGYPNKVNDAVLPFTRTQSMFKVTLATRRFPKRARQTIEPYTFQHKRWTHPPRLPPSLFVGDAVMINYNGEFNWILGSIEQVHTDEDTCNVLYESGKIGEGVPYHWIQKFTPIEENARVDADFEGEGILYTGIVTTVMPNGNVDVFFDDGSLERNIEEARIIRLV